ncbi:bacteriophage antitermination protein Q [Serratia ureilytica]|uniref:bacteriophage antitermination protein Q n=1 Tax=Serratia ureilytica TaxID=300181 RepID=UPI0037214A1E
MNLEWVRDNIRTALADIHLTGNGQLGALAERTCIETNRFNRNPPRYIVLGEKKVRRHSVPVEIKQTRAKGSSAPLMLEIDYALVPWRRAINSLEEPLQAWIRYCYGDYRHRNEQFKVVPYIWEQFSKLCASRISNKVKHRLQGLTLLAVQTVASMIKGFPKDYTHTQLAELSGVSKSTWSETYSGHWNKLISLVEELDSEALHLVAEKRISSRSRLLAS